MGWTIREGRELLNEIERVGGTNLFGLPQVYWATSALVTPVLYDGKDRKVRGQAHTLFVGVPGTGKTALTNNLTAAIRALKSTIQGGPDIMPPNITGGLVPIGREIYTVKGPVFCNVCVVDEINRIPPKAQAEFLSPMDGARTYLNEINSESNEKKLKSVTYPLYPIPEDPKQRNYFILFGTANTLESEGVNVVIDALMSRVTYSYPFGYPDEESERRIRSSSVVGNVIEEVTDLSVLAELSEFVAGIPVSETANEMAMRLIRSTRPEESKPYLLGNFAGAVDTYVENGLPSRKRYQVEAAAKVQAMRQGRDVVTVQDIKEVALVTMAHELRLKRSAQRVGLDNFKLVQMLLRYTKAP